MDKPQYSNNTVEDDDSVYEAVDDGPSVFVWILIVVAVVLGILLLLYLIRKFIQGGQYRKKNRIDGKVVVITGCNTGIGKKTVLDLASRGAKVYMACRDFDKCEAARTEIIKETGNNNVFNRTLDLSSLESIRNFAKKFIEEETRLDILINNAGVMACPKTLTNDGLEMQMGVNHLGHFYLTHLLLETLKKSAPSRIVIVSSVAYIFAKIRKNDFNCEKYYDKFERYTESKLANLLFMHRLAKELEGTGVTVNALHPGVVKTELGRHFVSKTLMTISTPITSYLMKSARAGAQTSIRLAVDPDLEKVSGCYFMDCIKFPVLSKAKDSETADWLWNISQEVTGMKQPNEA